ncbi:threonine/serine dehydratase [Bacillus sp. 03113]|uniref:threonine ammonia-lyase n=1 Tax=Bacillus sp. 03113 TaxID=2578211 RepID=UPI0011437F8C|nr:threonine/serine dehydratase [Bacillus sp. 03113]
MEKTTVTLQDIQEAAERISPYIHRTPLLRGKNMDEVLGCQIYLKPEMLQVTGAFKLRGALSKILSLTPDERKKGIITSSSGNHAQACAYAGKMLGIHTTVVIPEDAPAIKIENAKAMGAHVIVWDRKYVERWKKVREEVAEHGYVIVHPYEDYTVMAGQGTIALEMMEDLPDVETVLVPIGGGGLISGISTALKELKPNVRVVGVQAAASCAYYVSRQNGYPSAAPCLPTVADGLSCRYPGENPFPIIEKYVDDIVIVEEEDIKEAVRLVAHDAKLVAEPSACAGIAALLSGRVKTRPDEKVCTVLTSGNWDIDMIGKILKEEHIEGVL